jgi:hypothetical protein
MRPYSLRLMHGGKTEVPVVRNVGIWWTVGELGSWLFRCSDFARCFGFARGFSFGLGFELEEKKLNFILGGFLVLISKAELVDRRKRAIMSIQ